MFVPNFLDIRVKQDFTKNKYLNRHEKKKEFVQLFLRFILKCMHFVVLSQLQKFIAFLTVV